MNKYVIIGIIIITLVGIGFIAFKPKPNNLNSQNQAENIVENVEKQIENKAGSGAIVAPGNLQDCPENWFETVNGRERVACDESIKAPYCSYYTLEKNGVLKTRLLQFTSECAVCRNHKRKGEVFGDSTAGKYTHLGYHKGECTQGMYKK